MGGPLRRCGLRPRARGRSRSDTRPREVGLLVAAGRGRIRIDADGLRATTLGATVLRVPVEDVAAADVVEVSPFREFGGWGLRVDTAGRIGLVTRRGPAVRVRRGDDSEVLITLDDSHDAAATLNSLADRVHRPN